MYVCMYACMYVCISLTTQTELQDSAAAPTTLEFNSRARQEAEDEARGTEALAQLRETFRNKPIQRIERQQFTFLCKQDSSVCRTTLRKMLQRVDIVLPRNELEIIFKHIGMDQLGKIRLELILPMNQHGSAMGGECDDDKAGPHSPTKSYNNNSKTVYERKQAQVRLIYKCVNETSKQSTYIM